jgi:thiol:disulfide interchange protein
MIKHRTLEQLQNSLSKNETCVVNLTADWCSDCTVQSLNLERFSEKLSDKNIDVYTLSMQKEKKIYISSEHQNFTDSVGGHGFPRTVLIINGKVIDAENVEIISTVQLDELAQKFLQQL